MSKQNLNLKFIEEKCEYYLYEKMQFHIPENIKANIVKYAPLALLILFLISTPLGIIGSFLNFIMFNNSSVLNYITDIIWFSSVIFYIISIPLLYQRKKRGWKFMFYAVLLKLFHTIIVNLFFIHLTFILSIFQGLFLALISLYLLFQVKYYYKL